jgi:glycosyltransferase (activator-dependent family)
VRVLFVPLPEKSHLYCMTPLAWALIAAGHEVRVAAMPALRDAVTGIGVTAVPVGRDSDIHERMAELPDSQDFDTASWSRCEPGEIGWEELLHRYELSVPFGFALYNDPMLADLVDFAGHWQPDLVVRDPLAYAAGIAAEACGAAHVRLLWCADVWGRSRETFRHYVAHAPERRGQDPLAEWLSASGEPYGVRFSEELVDGQATIDMLPAELRLPSTLRELPMRYVAHNGPAVVWDWLREPVTRPRVCLTLGTSNIEGYGDDYVSVLTVLRELADLDIEVVAALAPAQRAKLGEVPANARIVDNVALHTLLPSCSAIIHHGGFGSFATALDNAVPQMIVSTSVSDHELRGRALEQSGAGALLHHTRATPSAVGDALRHLLNEPAVARSARRLRDAMATMPPPARLVDDLENLAAARRTDKPLATPAG